MATHSRFPSVNPHLTTQYAIFTSSILSLFFILVILEQLGISQSILRNLSILIPILCVMLIGLLGTNNENEDFFTSGRRVPSVYNGFSIAITTLGGTGLLGLIGSIFFLGVDAMAIGIGWAAGLLFITIMFAPYIRKMGAYTIPSFFANRYDSASMRFLYLAIIIIPIFMILLAEIHIAIFAASIIFELPKYVLALAILTCIIISLIGGGMRSLTWTQCAQFIIVMIGILVPLIIAAIQITNIPIPQLTYGSILDNISELEQASGITSSQTQTGPQLIPGQFPEFSKKPFLEDFISSNLTNFVLLSISIMLGTASLPGLLTRMSTTPSVYDARKSTAWGVALVGFLIITAPAYAAFTKLALFQYLQQHSIDQLPSWITTFQQNGIFSFGNTTSAFLDMKSLGISRDGVIFILPQALKLPNVLILLSIATAILLSMAAASMQILMLSNMISHDIFYNLFSKRLPNNQQINISRLSMIVITLLIAWVSTNIEVDSLKLLLYALCITGSSLFPALVMSIWWKACNKTSVALGMITGFFSAVFVIYLNEMGINILSSQGYSAAVIGASVNLVTILIVNLISPPPINIENDIVEDLRVPGGETLYDRVLRNELRKQQKAMALQ